ncbi:50S ribosomal protein L4 [Buchnera aphidicola]|uniref:Large ribosomal subunit protein uL4 n=1 Tax=Buchnera aphidicola subsp. Tuberolachnus salignus TaxID=98804 RepID=A0A160SX17_BUCTT|nr:50S ribosomal protein L4 [Buchnera aphidicola]CUR53320.1 50S ribosomal protein L4 [Buchnera aphidicola (Tuberolachnus salignus)]
MDVILRDTKEKILINNKNFLKNFNESLVHQIIVAYLSRQRQGSKAQKNKSEVSGSGKKPWRQKGTGRARAGSLRSPLWRSGGVTFAAKPRKFIKKINKKMYKRALQSIFSELIRQKRLILFQNFVIEKPKTQILVSKLKKLNIKNVLIITLSIDNNLYLAARNLYQVKILSVSKVDPVSLISFKNVLMTVNVYKNLEESLI